MRLTARVDYSIERVIWEGGLWKLSEPRLEDATHTVDVDKLVLREVNRNTYTNKFS